MAETPERKQKYAVNRPGGWTVLEADIPCNAGEGLILATGLSEQAMKDFLGIQEEAPRSNPPTVTTTKRQAGMVINGVAHRPARSNWWHSEFGCPACGRPWPCSAVKVEALKWAVVRMTNRYLAVLANG